MSARFDGMARKALISGAIVTAIVVPIIAAALSPLLAWRDPIYIAAGFAGIIAMALMFLQPLLVAGLVPGASGPRARRVHRWIGGSLVIAVILHVAGLWITSRPDMIDALLFVSPTPFSIWGVIAMWVIFATAALAGFRKQLRPQIWRRIHASMAVVIVAGSVIHAVLIEGTMETISKAALCALVVAATLKALISLRVFASRPNLR